MATKTDMKRYTVNYRIVLEGFTEVDAENEVEAMRFVEEDAKLNKLIRNAKVVPQNGLRNVRVIDFPELLEVITEKD